MYILHTCDNPACCNPKHLFCGSQQDNMKDMAMKKRGKRSKLYASEIWLVRRLKGIRSSSLGRYNSSREFVAAMFEVTPQTIGNIWNSTKSRCKEGYYV